MTVPETTVPNPPALAPSVIGFKMPDGEVVGLSGLGRLVLEPFRRPTSARAHFVAAGALAAQGVRLAVADLLRPAASPAETVPAPVVLTATASLPPAPAVVLIEATSVTEAPAKAKRPRWTAAERKFLAAELDKRSGKQRPGYKAIARLMTAEFGRTFTAASVGQQGRRLRAAATVPAPAGKPATKRRRSTGRAPAAA